MRIAITTDSNSGITAQEAETLGIFLLPMPVIIDEETYLEGLNIHTELLVEGKRDYHTDHRCSGTVPGRGSIRWR